MFHPQNRGVMVSLFRKLTLAGVPRGNNVGDSTSSGAWLSQPLSLSAELQNLRAEGLTSGRAAKGH
jgi:hypothetical protein